MDTRIKKTLLISIFAILFLPMLQKALPFIKSGELYGEYMPAGDVDFTCASWFDGSYWPAKSNYLNDQIGFRPDLVRLNNQVDYYAYNKLYNRWGITNKDHCLMQPFYIKPYMGQDFVGYDTIREKMRKFKAIQDTLARLGKSLILIQSPCKAFYYPECIPDEYLVTPRGPTNYETYSRVADSMGINQIDFNKWFVSMKGKSSDLIYTKGGLHWSTYGAMVAGDSLVKYMEQLRHIRMPRPVWTQVEHTTKARFSDDDIEQALNLIIPFYKETYSYPIVSYPTDSSMTKPKVIYIGDSFLFQWMDQWFFDNTNSDWQIWYYFRKVYDRPTLNGKQMVAIANYDWLSELNKNDCIVVMYTSHNLHEIGEGFIEKAYAHYYPDK